MRITLDVPDELVASLAPAGCDAGRAALEAWGLEAYREGRLSGYQLRVLLDIPSRWDLDAFLKEHDVFDYTIDDFEKDLATIQKVREKEKAPHPA